MVLVDKPFINFDLPAYYPKSKKVGTVGLSDLKKKKQFSVLFFYPADFTFVCPTELKDLAKRYDEFQKLNCKVYGISTDTVYTHKAWLETEELLKDIEYPLLADHNGAFSKELAIYDESSGMTQRAAYILDPDAILKAVMVVADNIGRAAGEILRQVKALDFVRKHPGQACPASWDTGEATLTPHISISGKVAASLSQDNLTSKK